METVTFKLASGRPGVPDQLFDINAADLKSGAREFQARARHGGRPHLLTLLPDDVAISEELSSYAAGFKQIGEYRADDIAPVVLVDKDFGKFRTMSSGNTFEHVPVKGAINGPMNFIDPGSSLDDYRVGYRFIGTVVNPITERNEDAAFRSRQEAVRMIQEKILLDREIDVVNLVTTLGNWATNQRKTLGAGFEWNDGADSNPIKDLQGRILASAQRGALFAMNEFTGFTFLNNAAVKDYMRQMYGDSPPTAISSATSVSGIVDFNLVGIGRIMICPARVLNTTTGVNDAIWPDGVISYLVQTPGMPADMMSIATCKTFRTRGPTANGYAVRTYRMDGIGPEGVEVVAVWLAEIEKMTGNNCGGIITNAIQ